MAWFTTTIIAAVTIILIFLIFQECYRFRWVLPYIKSTPKIRNRIARIDPKTPKTLKSIPWSMYNKIRQLCTESSTLNINSSIK